MLLLEKANVNKILFNNNKNSKNDAYSCKVQLETSGQSREKIYCMFLGLLTVYIYMVVYTL